MSIAVMLVDVGIEYGNLATIQRWLKQDGEQVAAGEPILAVETAKATAEVVAPASGRLQILAPEGADWDIAEPVAMIAAHAADEAPRPASPGEAHAATATVSPEEPGRSAAAAREAEGRPVRSSPGARKLARAHGIRLEDVTPGGPFGRVVEADVRRAVEALAAQPAAGSGPAATARAQPEQPAARPRRHAVELSRVRRVIAERMAESLRQAAPVTLTLDADMTQAAALRTQLVDDPALDGRGKVGYTDLVVKSAARALRRHPNLNACLEDGRLYHYDDVHVGVAVATPAGLLVAVLRHADRRPLLDLAEELRALAAKAQQGHLSAEEMSGATFAVTNLGARGVDAFTPIIHQPAAGILGVGAVRERVVARGGSPEVRLTCVLSLSFDHRITDGDPAAAFLAEVREGLERPYRLLLPASNE